MCGADWGAQGQQPSIQPPCTRRTGSWACLSEEGWPGHTGPSLEQNLGFQRPAALLSAVSLQASWSCWLRRAAVQAVDGHFGSIRGCQGPAAQLAAGCMWFHGLLANCWPGSWICCILSLHLLRSCLACQWGWRCAENKLGSPSSIGHQWPAAPCAGCACRQWTAPYALQGNLYMLHMRYTTMHVVTSRCSGELGTGTCPDVAVLACIVLCVGHWEHRQGWQTWTATCTRTGLAPSFKALHAVYCSQ